MWRRASVLSAVALLTGCAHGAGTREVSAVFRLPKDTFCVGEPIVIEFTVTNGSSSTFVFEDGGDCRGILRHEQYSFRVVNTEGRDFTQELLGSLGGEIDEIELEPGQWFRSWQLLNSWVHLLPPGRYRVHCERRLGPAWPMDEPGGPTFRQDLSFEVVPYSKDRIVSTIAALRRMEEDLMKEEMLAQDGQIPKSNRALCVDVPVDWAIDDLGDKLRIPDGELREALPESWDDRYYIEYVLERSWLTTGKPDEWLLTFLVRNNGTVDLAHGLADSTFTVNGVPVVKWPEMMKRMLAEKNLGDMLAPGSVAGFSGTFQGTANVGKLEILGTALEIDVPPATIAWTIRGVEITPEVSFVR